MKIRSFFQAGHRKPGVKSLKLHLPGRLTLQTMQATIEVVNGKQQNQAQQISLIMQCIEIRHEIIESDEGDEEDEKYIEDEICILSESIDVSANDTLKANARKKYLIGFKLPYPLLKTNNNPAFPHRWQFAASIICDGLTQQSDWLTRGF